jgi:hypothetical protein
MDRFATFEDAPPPRAGPAPTIEELRAVRGRILEIVARNRGRNVRIFGSVARGDAEPDSDVDFLVDLEEGASLLDLGGMDTELRELLGRDVDVVHFHRWTRPRFRARVERESVAL